MATINGYSNFIADGVQGSIVGKSYTPPGAWYIGLGTDVNFAPDASNWVEVSGGSYARVQVLSAGWTAPGASPTFEVSNVSDITFPTSTASWGTITVTGAWLTIAGVTGAELIMGGELVDHKTIGVDTTAIFLAGQFRLTCSNKTV